MKRYCVLLLSLFTLALSASAQTLSVRVNNIESVEGNLRVAIYDNADGFRSVPDALAKIETPVTGISQVIRFPGIPSGTYAVAVFHDKDKDGELSTNFVGYPPEGCGLSNDAMGYIGPPSYEIIILGYLFAPP